MLHCHDPRLELLVPIAVYRSNMCCAAQRVQDDAPIDFVINAHLA
jgi:hypothetical protein